MDGWELWVGGGEKVSGSTAQLGGSDIVLLLEELLESSNRLNTLPFCIEMGTPVVKMSAFYETSDGL